MEMETELVRKSAVPRLWTGPFITIMTVNTFIAVCTNMMVTALPLYVQFLGSSKSVAGLIMGVYTVASVTCRPVFGNMVDNRGRKIVLLIGIGLFVATCIGFSFTSVVVMILIIRGFQGMGYAAHSTAAGTVVADVLPRTRLAEGVGYYGVSYNIASSFGPALAIFMIGSTGYHSVFYATFGISIAAFLMSFSFNYEKKAKQNQNDGKQSFISTPEHAIERTKRKVTIDMLIERSAIPGAMVMVLIMIPNGMVQSFLPSYGLSMGIKDVGLYFTFNAIALIISRLSVGKLCDRLGPQRVLLPGLSLIFTGLIMVSFARSLFIFILAGMTLGFGYGIVNPTVQAFIMGVAAQNRKGAASATYFSANDTGIGLGSIIGGVMAQALGYSTTFFIYSFLVIAAIFVFYFVLRKKITSAD